MPRALSERPTPKGYLRYPTQVFWELSQTRQQAMAGTNALTLTEFNAYCAHHKIGHSDAQDIWWCIRVLDNAYRAYMAEKAQKKSA